ncbi:MAG: peptidoglycan DD-metalloendopeptidase family protein [Patescibacteria group bacterium]
MYIIANRFAIHFIIVAVCVLTIVSNVGVGSVRAETYGQKSLLYGLVSQDDLDTVTVVQATQSFERHETSYFGDGSIDASAHIDFDYAGDEYTSTFPSQIDVVPTFKLPMDSVSVREAVEQYIVEEGDSIWSIAESYGLNVSTLLWSNNLTFQSLIKPGQKITIPQVDGVMYTVKKGDTLLKIAKTFDADIDEVISFNQLASADDLVIGEELMIPGGEISAPVVRRTASVSQFFTGSGAGSGNWIWPTDMRVITQYFGWRHTGLDIDADYSTKSYAAAPGVVTYSGWRGDYGIMVEINHGGGLVARYAHHSKNYVSVGDTVYAGQAIAQSGSTGRSTGTHLHFEVIKNGVRKNPLDYIR